MTSIKIEGLSGRALDLIQAGVIVVSINVSQDGNDVWARVAQPHPRLGIYTNESFEVDTLVEKLKKVAISTKTSPRDFMSEVPRRGKEREFSGEGKSVGIRSRPIENLADNQDILLTSKMPGLKTIHRNGVVNKVPKGSLIIEDFDRPGYGFPARCLNVASEKGTKAIVAKISCDSDLRVDGARTIFEWWQGADSDQKLKVLTTRAAFGDKKTYDTPSMNPKIERAFSMLQCPFRDPEAALVLSQTEEDSEQELDIFHPSD